MSHHAKFYLFGVLLIVTVAAGNAVVNLYNHRRISRGAFLWTGGLNCVVMVTLMVKLLREVCDITIARLP